MKSASLAKVWRNIIEGDDKSWVLFKNGTCVVVMEPEGDLKTRATDLLREWGPVHAGSSFGDIGTIKLPAGRGWVVTSHHNDILTFVAPNEVDPGEADNLRVGMLGRSKRGQDANQLQVIHVEDRR